MKPFSSVGALLLFSGIFAGISLATWQATPARAWEQVTHKEFAERAAKYVSQEGLNNRLTTDYALPAGLAHTFKYGGKNNSGMKWIIEGADREDAPDCRVFAHWHDPLMPIGNEGFQPYLADPVFRGPSARKWGFGVDPGKQSEKDGFAPKSFPAFGCDQNLENMSWKDARSYFERALTEPSQSDREVAFAQMFKAIGHVMHLIQDNANPAHARNDNHLDVLGALNLDLTSYGINGFPDPDNFHKYVQFHKKAEILTLDHNKIKKYTQKAETLLGTKSAGGSMPPPGNLIDSDQYMGTNPEVTTSGVTGTAEFANANFFTDDTTPDVIAGRTYPHPSLGELNGGFPFYWSLQRKPLTLQHALKNNLGSAILSIAYPQYCLGLQALGQSCGFKLDDAIFDDYFKELGPRAVANSAALLQYFFRGQLGAEAESAGEGKVLLWITNKSAQPLMGGSFSIYTDSETGERTQRGEKYNLASYGLSMMLNPGQRLLYPIEIPRQTLGDAEVIHIVYEGGADGGLGTESNLENGAIIGLMNVPVQKPQYNLTVINNSSVGDTVTFNPTGINCGSAYPCQRYDAGTSVTVTLTPESGYIVKKWTGCEEATENTCTVTMSSDRPVSAEISKDGFSLNIIKRGGGIVSSEPSGINCGAGCGGMVAKFEYGSKVTLTAEPSLGYTFSEWDGQDFECSGLTSTTCVVTMDSQKGVYAIFLPIASVSIDSLICTITYRSEDGSTVHIKTVASGQASTEIPSGVAFGGSSAPQVLPGEDLWLLDPITGSGRWLTGFLGEGGTCGVWDSDNYGHCVRTAGKPQETSWRWVSNWNVSRIVHSPLNAKAKFRFTNLGEASPSSMAEVVCQ